jgi:hypothetical protein
MQMAAVQKKTCVSHTRLLKVALVALGGRWLNESGAKSGKSRLPNACQRCCGMEFLGIKRGVCGLGVARHRSGQPEKPQKGYASREKRGRAQGYCMKTRWRGNLAGKESIRNVCMPLVACLAAICGTAERRERTVCYAKWSWQVGCSQLTQTIHVLRIKKIKSVRPKVGTENQTWVCNPLETKDWGNSDEKKNEAAHIANMHSRVYSPNIGFERLNNSLSAKICRT